MKVEDNSRPEWEDVDPKQVLQGGQYTEQYLQQFPQDKRAIFGDQYVEESKAGGSSLQKGPDQKDANQMRQDPNVMMDPSNIKV